MKKLCLILAIAASMALPSCKSDDTPLNSMTISDMEDQLLSFDLMDDVLEEVEYTLDLYYGELKTGIDDCRTITVVPMDRVTWPKTITIDFGTEGCLVRDSVTKKGKIIINQSGPQFGESWTKVITFEDYYVNDNKIEGTHTIVFTRGANPTWVTTVTDGQITTPDGVIRTRNAVHTRRQVEGMDTPRIRIDNVFEITGNGSGTRKDGKAFSTVITEPLVVSHDCRWIRKGIKTLTLEGRNDITIDYGSGTCDNKAMASQDGTSREITLRGRRW